MKYTTLLYTTASKNAWILSYNFMNMWSWNKTLSEIFALIWSGFWPKFMALFHIVPRGIFKSHSKMGCRAYCKLSKIPKNSLRSFLSRKNRRDEVRVLSLELQVILWWTKFKIQSMLHNLYFSGLKLVRNSIINGLHRC